MDRRVGPREEGVERAGIGQRARHDLGAPGREKSRAARSPCEGPNGVPAVRQVIDEMSADEPRGTRDGDAHGPPPYSAEALPSSRKTRVRRRATTAESAS